MAQQYSSFAGWVASSLHNARQWRIQPSAGMDLAICDYFAASRALDAGVPLAEVLAYLPARVSPRAADFDAAAVVNAVLHDKAASAGLPQPTRHQPSQPTAIRGLRIYTGRPRTVDLDVAGQPMTCPAGALKSRNEFKRECLESLGLLPILPAKADEWDALVADVLAQCETVEEPEEASIEGHEFATVEMMVRQIQMGDCLSDLNAGKWLDHESHRVIRQFAVADQFRARLPQMSPASLARHLRACGWTPGQARVDGVTVRVWRQDIEMPPDEVGPTAALTAAAAARQAKMQLPMTNNDHLGFFGEESH